MQPATESIEVCCPKCGEEYLGWYRPDEGRLTDTKCPLCGHDPASDPLVHEDGLWLPEAGDEEVPER
jgi:hypothetical protein